MGQKVSPVGLRIGINKDWESKWYANKKDISTFLKNDVQIRKYLEKNASEGMLVCLCKLLFELSARHIDLKDKIYDFAKFILTLDANGKYSEKEAKCILSM